MLCVRRFLHAAIVLALPAVAGFGAESPAPPNSARYRQGTWVNYRILASERQLYFSLSGNIDNRDGDPAVKNSEFSCRLTVLKNDNGKLQIDIEAANPALTLTNATLNDILLGDLLPPEKIPTHGSLATRKFPATAAAPAREISVVESTVIGEGRKITLVKSEEVPFKIVEITCGAFHLELLDYQW